MLHHVLRTIADLAFYVLVGYTCGLTIYTLPRIAGRVGEVIRFRATLTAIAAADLPEPPSAHATLAQWMRSLARDALDPKRHDGPDPRIALQRQINMAMTGRAELDRFGPGAAPKPPPVAPPDDLA